MLRRTALASLPFLVAACGGGGGGAPPVQPSAPTRVAIDDLEIPAAAPSGELVVRLASVPPVPPTLLQLEFELPAALAVPATDRLRADAAVPDLDGDVVGNRFVVVCGDARNTNATALQPGALFRLRVQPTAPRQPGTYTVRLTQRGADREGSRDVLADAAAVTATVVVR